VYFSISQGISMCSHQFSESANALQFDELAYAIHVTLNDVSAEASVGLHGKFQVDQCPFMHARKMT